MKKFPFKADKDVTRIEWILFLLLLGLSFITGILIVLESVSAQNETCTGDICPSNETLKNISIEEKSNCSEQLQLLLDEYNNLTIDYHSGANCGTVRYLLIDNNAKLSDNLKKCNEKVGEYTVYKYGFYFLFLVMIAVILCWIIASFITRKNSVLVH